MKIQWKQILPAFALPLAMAFVAPAQALPFMVDDFNTTTTYVCNDPTQGGDTCGATPIDASNKVWGVLGGGGATRTINATLLGGDTVGTEICSNCQTGHLVSGAGPSVGDYFFEWSGGAVDLSGGTFAFDWIADLGGATWVVSLHDGVNPTWNSAAQGGLVGGGVATVASLSLAGAIGSVDLTAITGIDLYFSGVQRLDADIDNVRVVPEPGVLALFSVGLLGLGWSRRRRAA